MRNPRTIPVLEPDDFIMGPLEDHEGRYCLLGWKEKVFGEEIEGMEVSGMHTATLVRCCKNAGRPNILKFRTADTPKNRKTAAVIWGDFIEELGYIEDGPETTID